MRFIIKLILAIMLSMQAVHAAPFIINFTGELESLTKYGEPGVDVIDSVFSIGDAVSGQIVVDTDNLASTSISSFNLSIGGYSASTSGGTATVRNDDMAGSSAPVVDSILIAGAPPFTSSTIGGLSVDRLQFAVGTENLSVLDNLSVVGPAEILALWADTPNYFSGNLNFMSFGEEFSEVDETARFALTSVSVTSVPEPLTAGLMGLGLAGIGFVRRKRIY